ncbi:MAG: glycoside hydrolase family 99-like domain-containing protein [Candidatus Accumulibacter phosphatis]|jgi:lipopolysaccharide biosynthesis protein|uniref:Glycosyl hydrolase n=2 Tax=Candidatus Accumulibacter TaxID=327159 RepID=A0A080M018_9PROT|nr:MULTISPECIES: glycoside hydrolase family 99-like domain-containing protein [Candidatus Accumulibacter]KFB74471.1 MAG: hypothetical protein AW09_000237 [Candidatus Accumulibacter phosphatis]NMQ04309.1 glycosyl hydrolase [Candidatus Accumulibacter contiguus]HRF06765.1 glycoside hydrolase family 99-like domain-containing protein [Accumulibacter sp.]
MDPAISATPDSKQSAAARGIRTVAFFLPQFHPIPENDAWWGKGFTEWTNVTKAAALFPGHYQPHYPADLGYYDLRLTETRHEQIAMARSYGIDAFCYHYYWFSGKRLLNRPLDEMLADSESNMPFCLCWANENWTRRWDAAEHEILIAQNYLPDDDLKFIRDLTPYLSDARYLRFDGVPLLIVYRPQQLPDPRKTASIWRDYCKANGIGEIYLCAALTHGNFDYSAFGFDSGVEFPPHNLTVRGRDDRLAFSQPFLGHAVMFHDIAESYLKRTYTAANVFRCVFPSWDNTARTGNRALIVLNGTPANYEYWLSEAIRRTAMDFPGKERLVFINAWNEWAEGCHLEPDQKFGRQFLEATRFSVLGISRWTDFSDKEIPEQEQPGGWSLLGHLTALVTHHYFRYKRRLIFKIHQMPRIKRIVKFLLLR